MESEPLWFNRRQIPALVALGVFRVVVVILFVLPGSGSRPAAPRTMCRNNLKQIGLALLNYAEDNNGHFPPAFIADQQGRPVHSWRTLILPYIEAKNLADRYHWDEPWNGPRNCKLADVVVPCLGCPASHGPATETSYMVVVGPRTMFPGAKSRTVDDVFKADGAAHTILVVEVAHSGVNWLEPRDLTFEEAIRGVNRPDGLGISSEHKGLAAACFADSSAHFLESDIPPDTLKKLLQFDDGGPKDFPQNTQ